MSIHGIKYGLCLTLSVFSICISWGQDPWYKNYSSSDKILEKLSRDSLNFEAAQEFSYIGEYEAMLKIWDRDGRKISAGLTSEQQKHFSGFKAVNAKEYILEKAKTEQIIIINEAHQQPYHRVFTTSLLHDLHKVGFRYFGAETISNYESTLSEMKQNKFPTINSGYYTREPFYGDLVREAIWEGYNVFAYETTRRGSSDSSGINLREIDQAKNIKKILDKDPKAKILIHCGWDHLSEGPYQGWGKAMAGRLYEYTGINPFTIDQTKLTEHSAPEYQNPYWASIDFSYSAVFVDSTGGLFYGPVENKQYDARLYHPKTKWLYGRPHWVFENNRTPYVLKEKITLSFPCLVFAFIAGEKKQSDSAIPFDIIELKSAEDKKALSLRKGQLFTIVIRDRDFRQMSFNVMTD